MRIFLLACLRFKDERAYTISVSCVESNVFSLLLKIKSRTANVVWLSSGFPKDIPDEILFAEDVIAQQFQIRLFVVVNGNENDTVIAEEYLRNLAR